jgi:hypothetical protein
MVNPCKSHSRWHGNYLVATEAFAGLGSEPGAVLFARGTASGASSLGGHASAGSVGR